MGCGAGKQTAREVDETKKDKGKVAEETKKEKDEAGDKAKKGKGDFKSTDNLAGGHIESFRFLPDGTMLKAGKAGELKFFEDFKDTNSKYYSELMILKPFMADFLGIEELEGKKWIKMKNLNHGLTHVSFMDIKMGDKSYSPDDPADKKENQIKRAKLTTSFEFGYRLTGMTIRNEKGETAFKLAKDFEAATKDKVPGYIRNFLMSNGKPKVNQDAAKHYVAKMKELLAIMETKITRFMIGSSLFFVLSNIDNKFDVKIIDFAHVFPCDEGKRDEGFIMGLKSLITLFEKIITDG